MMDLETAWPVSREQMLDWYRMMLLIRRFEELAAKAYTLKRSSASATCTSDRRRWPRAPSQR
jgi:TPP-dependent pyruvate/acetoin dehydrogenase alpha subunit